MNLDKTAVITLDTDWIPVSIMQDIVENIMPAEIPATFFVTGSYPCLSERKRDYELAPHTNPPELNEAALTAELDRKMEYCEGKATGHRGHSLYWSERLRPLFRDRGIRYDSSTMMYLESNIRPFRMGFDLLQIPLFFMDFFHFEYCGFSDTNPFDIEVLNLNEKGLKVFDFHPIHLFLNTPHLNYYASVKSYYQEPIQLAKHRFDGYGTRNHFVDIIQKLQSEGYQFTTLKNISHG